VGNSFPIVVIVSEELSGGYLQEKKEEGLRGE